MICILQALNAYLLEKYFGLYQHVLPHPCCWTRLDTISREEHSGSEMPSEPLYERPSLILDFLLVCFIPKLHGNIYVKIAVAPLLGCNAILGGVECVETSWKRGSPWTQASCIGSIIFSREVMMTERCGSPWPCNSALITGILVLL